MRVSAISLHLKWRLWEIGSRPSTCYWLGHILSLILLKPSTSWRRAWRPAQILHGMNFARTAHASSYVPSRPVLARRLLPWPWHVPRLSMHAEEAGLRQTITVYATITPLLNCLVEVAISQKKSSGSVCHTRPWLPV